MDELDILKKDWKKKDHSFNQITEKEIYGMLHKRSSSIVKWILIISVLEIALWSILGFLTTDDNYIKKLEILHLKETIMVLNFLNYAVIFYFIYKFYKNYQKINSTDSIKSLMSNILNTRKIVKHYIWYNLGMIFISFMLVFSFSLMYDPSIIKMTDSVTKNMNENSFYIIVTLLFILFALVIVSVFWLFYKLIYGVLLKRLNNNYEELKKLEI